MSPTHTGGCRCGAVRFEAGGEPICATYCHCSDCRRASGAPLSAFVGFLTDNVRFHGSRGASYGNHPVQRSFCSACGAPIAYVDARLEEQIFFVLGAMDRPELYPPTVHGYVGEQLPFLT
ncbi:GFA family protein [Rhizobium sp. BK376]|uniref:GFA family protein n=1 Tax=Rhizobium sp. BK376 TaxID=2512149 RepID=UPI0010DEB01D|nr:GFA family protein [Rhizobium sp. BK376]TCR70975.1 hypothetical protein EV561_1376 [Rhizobium sp. BK376]